MYTDTKKPIFIPKYDVKDIEGGCFTSEAEKDLYKELEIINIHNTYILHSVNLAYQKYKQCCEIDFVIICKKGIAFHSFVIPCCQS